MKKDEFKKFTKKQLHEVNKKLYGMIIEMIRSTVKDSMIQYVLSNPLGKPLGKFNKIYIRNMLDAVNIDMVNYKEQITTCALNSFGKKVDYKQIASGLWDAGVKVYMESIEKDMFKKGKNGKKRVCPRPKR